MLLGIKHVIGGWTCERAFERIERLTMLMWYSGRATGKTLRESLRKRAGRAERNCLRGLMTRRSDARPHKPCTSNHAVLRHVVIVTFGVASHLIHSDVTDAVALIALSALLYLLCCIICIIYIICLTFRSFFWWLLHD